MDIMGYIFIFTAIIFGILVLRNRIKKDWTHLGFAITLGLGFLSLAYSDISLDTKLMEFSIAICLMCFSVIVTYLFTLISIKDIKTDNTTNEKIRKFQSLIEKSFPCLSNILIIIYVVFIIFYFILFYFIK